MSVSQPFASLPSQLAKPVVHDATVQRPAAQAGVAFASMQAVPQAPQFATLVTVSTSQPLAATPSQSWKPASQVKPQAVPLQVAEALAGATQGVHDAPQVATAALLTQVPVQT